MSIKKIISEHEKQGFQEGTKEFHLEEQMINIKWIDCVLNVAFKIILHGKLSSLLYIDWPVLSSNYVCRSLFVSL